MNHSDYPQIRQAGENALLIYLAPVADPQVLAQVQWLSQQLRQQLGSLLQEIIPSYNSVLLVYDFLRLDQSQLELCLADLLAQLPELALRSKQGVSSSKSAADSSGKLIELPCYYSAETGPDLAAVAAQHHLSVNQLIKIHSEQQYQVYAIGFAPGFAYLGWVDERIATVRLTTLRLKVPAGSVAIADRQTAVYPAASPGGWNLLGNCPIPLFDLQKDPPMALSTGDAVRFVPIERAEYLRLGGQL
ncbi:5-oxoprolinase subunit PxpB [Rheinheimera riviphila]|uniref:5-oxoprolinase subunit PxpB n=1 Tax=Rheinheimera riviphila TaxID=1834037 RepID=A0A437QSR9_9GAMM|nr:5-oxoprolinase subunit PxpB [Rheinheimera riviphila]RVU37563.1 5-oxoprolinase subunit PxpB [Rheinheimera riviphila]